MGSRLTKKIARNVAMKKFGTTAKAERRKLRKLRLRLIAQHGPLKGVELFRQYLKQVGGRIA